MMNISIAEMEQRFSKLGLKEPTLLAFLPLNFLTASNNEELQYAAISKEIEHLLLGTGMAVESLDRNEDRLYVDNRSADIFLPFVIFTLQCISEHPDVVDSTLELIAKYLGAKFEKLHGRSNVRFKYANQSADGYEVIEYEGPVEGLVKARKFKSKIAKSN
jgi:hypothetical protein